jgi:YCII-related domain-containing protein
VAPDGGPASDGPPDVSIRGRTVRLHAEAGVPPGVLLDCAPPQPPVAATTVSVRDGETLLTEGPAAEIKEHFGGYTLVECADLDEALKWAATLPVAQVEPPAPERAHPARRMREW